MNTDTDTLVAKVREALKSEALHPDPNDWGGLLRDGWLALDALAAELERLREHELTARRRAADYLDELERVKAERDKAKAELVSGVWVRPNHATADVERTDLRRRAEQAEARLGKALKALRLVQATPRLIDTHHIARAAIAEVGGEYDDIPGAGQRGCG